jgi:hypothetical protein
LGQTLWRSTLFPQLLHSIIVGIRKRMVWAFRFLDRVFEILPFGTAMMNYLLLILR